MKDVIDVSKIEQNKRYIDLSGYAKNIRLVGEYEGDRIVLNNCLDRRLMGEGCVIKITRKEEDKDELVLNGQVNGIRDFELTGIEGLTILNGGITVWGAMQDVLLYSLTVKRPNHGIRASEDQPHKNVKIIACSIANALREGIYFAPHTLQTIPSQNIEIAYNLIVGCLWDGIQAQGEGLDIHDNEIDECALAEYVDQWFGILIQKGSFGYVYRNKITRMKRPRAVLQSTIFYQPKNL